MKKGVLCLQIKANEHDCEFLEQKVGVLRGADEVGGLLCTRKEARKEGKREW
jgi:hypothetical protein